MTDVCAYGDDKCPILGGARPNCVYCGNHAVERRKLECYPAEETVGCAECMRDRLTSADTFAPGEAFLVGMLDSPYGDGQAHYFCKRHLSYFWRPDELPKEAT